jgi:hypothetical protein
MKTSKKNVTRGVTTAPKNVTTEKLVVTAGRNQCDHKKNQWLHQWLRPKRK